MNIKLKIDGKETSPDHLGAAVEDAVLAKIKEQLNRKLAGLRCPEHGQTPQLEFEGDSLATLRIQIRPCCERIGAEAQRLLNQK